MPTTDDLLASLQQLGEEYAAFVESVSEAAFHYRPAPQEWTAAELTGHVAEFPVTFSGQASRLAQNPGLALGRSLDDPGRLAAVAKLASASSSEAASMVRSGVGQTVATLRAVPADGWEVSGQHRLGQLSVREVVERFIVDHLREHLGQARATVASAGTSG